MSPIEISGSSLEHRMQMRLQTTALKNHFMKQKPFQINRRRFIKTTAAIAAATGVPAWFIEQDLARAASPKPLNANDKPGIALVGCGGQGRGDCHAALARRPAQGPVQ